jgi:hypothetical protein
VLRAAFGGTCCLTPRRTRRAQEGDEVEQVALSAAGRTLRLATSGERRLRADQTTGDGAFERVELGHGRVALRTAEGSYLTVLPDAGLGLGLYPWAELTPAGAFEEILWPTGEVSLRSSELTYVAVDEALPTVTVNLTQPLPTTRLRYVRLPVGVVPPQRTAYAPRGEAVPAAGHPG